MSIVLVHNTFRPPEKLVFFYDGHLVAYNGVLTIPDSSEQSFRWAKQAYLNGYNTQPNGTLMPLWTNVEDYIRSAKSAEPDPITGYGDKFDSKSAGVRRQPGLEHRIRSSKSSRSKPVPEDGLESSVSGGSEVEG